MAQAKDVMTWPVRTVGERDRTSWAAELLARYRFTALPVVDEDFYLIGIVSEADLIPQDEQTTIPVEVGSVMTTDVISMLPGTDLDKLTHWLLKLSLRVMPITDSDGRLVGIVTRGDVLRRNHLPDTTGDWLAAQVKRIFLGKQVGAQAAPDVGQPAPTRRTTDCADHAGDIMTTNPVRVRETTPIGTAIELLAKYHFTALPVVDGQDRLLGIVSGADLIPDPREETILYPRKRRNHTPRTRTVGSVMTTNVVSRRPGSDLTELAHWLLTMHRRVMPIVDDDERLVGVVTRSDLMRARDQLDLPPLGPAEERSAALSEG